MASSKKPTVKEGDIFYRLTVIRLSHKDKRWRRHYLCSCICGVTKTVQGTLLTSNNTRSCGCLSREVKRSTRLANDGWAINQLILRAKRHAKDRSLIWSLSKEFVDLIVRLPCEYCGVKSSNVLRDKKHLDGFPYNGLDRVDNSHGYVETNVVPCCKMCNIAKQDHTVEEFKEWITRLSAFSINWK